MGSEERVLIEQLVIEAEKLMDLNNQLSRRLVKAQTPRWDEVLFLVVWSLLIFLLGFPIGIRTGCI